MRLVSIAILLTSALQAGAVDSGDVRAAVQKAVPLLEKSGTIFWEKSGCISCHHHTLPSLAVATARQRGFAVDEATAKVLMKLTADYLEVRTERILQGITPPGAEDTMSYILFGLAVGEFPGNAGTGAGARYLRIRQAEDGRWRIRAHRPPLESSAISLTAVTIRVLQAYTPPAQREQSVKSIARAVQWLALARPRNTEETSFQVLGLVWAHGPQNSIAQTVRRLAKAQRTDGGWSQLPTLASDAYATGQALVALQEAGMRVTDPSYERGVAFLLRTQHPDGSWFVKSRSDPFQPYFESGFPYGPDQWISAAGTSWATTALALTQPKLKEKSAGTF